MFKLKIYLFSLFAVAVMPSFSNINGTVLSYTPLQAEEKLGMHQVQLVMKKLRASMSSMKDFDELEAAGMSKKDVDRMRRAMSQKIEKLTSEAIDLIRAL